MGDPAVRGETPDGWLAHDTGNVRFPERHRFLKTARSPNSPSGSKTREYLRFSKVNCRQAPDARSTWSSWFLRPCWICAVDRNCSGDESHHCGEWFATHDRNSLSPWLQGRRMLPDDRDAGRRTRHHGNHQHVELECNRQDSISGHRAVRKARLVRVKRITRWSTAVVTIVFLSAGVDAMAQTILDFEDVATGTTVGTQYASRGVIFNSAYLIPMWPHIQGRASFGR